MAVIGVLDKFDINGEESFDVYYERVDLFFLANDITDAAKKKATFLTSIGVDAYRLVRSLCTPDMPSDKSLTDIVKLLKDHLAPEPNSILERFKFYSRNRKDGESVADYVVDLRRLSRNCKFGTSLKEMLRDRIVCGINDTGMQRKMLSRKDLTFDQAFEIATGTEAAAKQADQMTIKCETQYVNKVDSQGAGSRRLNCYRCGDSRHLADNCLYRDKKCFKCEKTGHISKVCREKGSSEPSKEASGSSSRGRYKGSSASKSYNQKKVDHDEKSEEGKEASKRDMSKEDDTEMYMLYKCDAEDEGKGEGYIYRCEVKREDPFYTKVVVDDVDVEFEIDTGASLTVMGMKEFQMHFPKTVLESTGVTLKTYTGETIKPVGKCDVTVQIEGSKVRLPMIVTPGKSPSLLGRNWLTQMKVDWSKVCCVNKLEEEEPQSLSTLVKEYEEVFKPGLGTFKDVRVKIDLQEGSEPKFMKARPVPYAIKKDVEAELERLVELDVYEPVSYSEWATPIVAVQEPGKIRLCGDYKVTVNPRAKSDQYPVPKTEDLLATLSGGQKFTKLDLTGAYHQLMLAEDSRECLTINTHKGLFRPKRLVFGVHMASGVFQRHMEKRLGHVARTIVRVDDILVTGESDKQHVENLKEVLEVCRKNGLRLKKEKCKFFMNEVDFLGYRISREGVKPIQDKIQSILEAQVPQNISQVKSFLGMIQYYHRHLPNIATQLEPLHSLLRKGVVWKWTDKQQDAFELAKQLLTGDNLLTHYDPNLQMVVHTDASPYGLGGVLSHVMSNGEEKPVAFISRTLSSHERNYSQIEKEGLAIVYAVKKFHQYLYGMKFEIVTDHKPLLGLLGEYKPVSVTAASRIQRWALLLSAYNYRLTYRRGVENGNADALSRLPKLATHKEVSEMENEVHMVRMDRAPVNAKEMATETRKDPLLSKVHDYILEGWPEEFEARDLWKPLSSRKDELSVDKGVVLWGNRVIVPKVLQGQVLEELHVAHTGCSKMKLLARGFVWWPGMDGEIENVVKSCSQCLANRSKPETAPVHPWEVPSSVWERIHIDYAGPFLGKMFLIVSDAFSKWLDVHVTGGSTSKETIEKLRHSFSTHGIPLVIVSDNGSSFVSEEFKKFCVVNGIKHVTSAPYHPATNGLAERSVRTFKEVLKKWKGDGDSVATKVERFLFSYRNTPHSATGISPAQILLKRRPRIHLSAIKPTSKKSLVPQQEVKVTRKFVVGEVVMARNYARGDKWIPGVVEKVTGPVSYHVKVEGGVIRRHIDQVIGRAEKPSIVGQEGQSETVLVESTLPEFSTTEILQQNSDNVLNPVTEEEEGQVPLAELVVPSEQQPEEEKTVELRRSSRQRSKPSWMESYC